MRFKDEIIRAVKHQAATDTEPTAPKTEEEIEAIAEIVRSSLPSLSYDFSKSDSIVLNQDSKKRFVKKYPDIYSPESVLCQCIKQILDSTFRIKYPNRNKSVRALFDVLRAVKQMADFTIIKYDFKDYFNSVSAPYVFEKYIGEKLADRFAADLIKKFVMETKYAYAGFSTSNVIAEIIAQQFDIAVRLALTDKGILFFERYIDDSIIVINEHIESSKCLALLQNTLSMVFHDNTVSASPKCKTKFNSTKFVHISCRNLNATPKTVDYLGYEFAFIKDSHNKVEISYGITQAKRDKYNSRIDEIIGLYKESMMPTGLPNPDFQNTELLRHRIAAFTSRTVYQSRRFKSIVWKTKGFISNYGELRYLLDSSLIDNTAKDFLINMINDAFSRATLRLPYFIDGAAGKSGFSLFENMKRNRTLVLVEHIGYSKPALVKLCSQVGINPIDKNGKQRGYGNLVREYLIKLKVGY